MGNISNGQIEACFNKMNHDYNHLINIFNQEFIESHNTQLCLGGDEPIYLPADSEHTRHRIIFARGFFASALHEVAHWCIAGSERRLLEDYGYWYQPDGRDQQMQAEFEKVEIVPQAVEWLLSASCGFPFQVSSDNLHGAEPDRALFIRKVHKQVLIYLQQGLPPRANTYATLLRTFYAQPPLTATNFQC